MRDDHLPPWATGSDTSLAAAESIDAGKLCQLVYRTIYEKKLKGITCDEIEVELGMRHQTASARVNDLMRGNHIIDSSKRRPTRSGRKAVVWVAARSLLA